MAEFEYDPAAGTSTLLREYLWFEGKPIAVIEGGVVYYVRSDHIGRPVFATDATGAKVWEAMYLPFGGVHTSTGNNINLRFPGQWFQSESGLHQNWMRDYDPTTGRYIQADPLGLIDGASVYGYARQNPGRYVDPRGEFVWLIPIVAGILLDAFVEDLKKKCSCSEDNEYKYTVLGSAYSATGPFLGKNPAFGSRPRTSLLSMLVHKTIGGGAGSVGGLIRRGGRLVSKRLVPLLGFGMVAADLYDLRNCEYVIEAFDGN